MMMVMEKEYGVLPRYSSGLEVYNLVMHIIHF